MIHIASDAGNPWVSMAAKSFQCSRSGRGLGHRILQFFTTLTLQSDKWNSDVFLSSNELALPSLSLKLTASLHSAAACDVFLLVEMVHIHECPTPPLEPLQALENNMCTLTN
ncbi:hypothetical protein SAY86_006530 [Trapa natans]|uniref:Uncharacterized protein n=1 Tax=Trapa natans TaxID=22666 RepID=A0AAN7LEC1_TRANT|nr:hypothetical protein SAY86_006530 [Trapa natans]